MEDFGPLLEAEIMERMDTATSFMQQLNMGMTPLAIAVTYLLKKGVVPLQYAIQQGNDGLVRLLLSKGASTDISSCEGTPLPVAVSQGKFEIVNTLVQHKADPNRVCSGLGTPMTAAVAAAEVTCVSPGKNDESVALECMKLPVKAGYDLNRPTPDTPLPIATARNLSECVKYLLEVGADANIPMNHAIKLDSADSLLHAQESLCHVMTSESYATTDSVRPCPNWFSYYDRIADGSTNDDNINEAVGSMSSCPISDEKFGGRGLTGSRQAIVAQDLIQNIVQIFVKVLDYPSISIQLECNSSIREMVYAALAKCHIHLPDVYVKSDGRIVSPETSLVLDVTDSTFTIVPRLRGGAPGDPKNMMNVNIEYVPLRNHIIGAGDSLFEVVYFRDQWPKWLGAHHIVFLGEIGRKIYKMLFELIEDYHGQAPQRCLRKPAKEESFTIDNIVYVPQYDCFRFVDVEVRAFSRDLYLKNVGSIIQILQDMFRYNPSKVSGRLPNIHELNQRISVLPRLLNRAVVDIRTIYFNDKLPPPVDTGLTKNSREQFLLDPAGKSSSDRIADLLGVDSHYDYLKVPPLRLTFRKCLGTLPQNEIWMPRVEKIPPMSLVLNFPCWYDRKGKAWIAFPWDKLFVCHVCIFGRNWVTHSDCGSQTEAEAIFSFLFPGLMRLATKAILCDYTDPPAPGGLEGNRTKLADVLRRK